MDMNSHKKDDFEACRHQSVKNIMETIVRHRPHLNPERLRKILRRARRIEKRIFNSATSQQDYHQRVSLKLFKLEERLKYHQSVEGDHGRSSNNLRMTYESVSLAFMVQKLSLESELRTTYHDQQARTSQQKDKFQVAHQYRLKQLDARDVAERTLPDIIFFESRDDIWPKLQQLKELHLPELTLINDFLVERTKQKMESGKMLQLIAWLELLRRVTGGLSTRKEDLPKKFVRGTMYHLEKQINDIIQIFRDSLADITESTQAADTSKATNPMNSIKSKSCPSTRCNSGPSSSQSRPSSSRQSESDVPSRIYLNPTDAHQLQEVTRQLRDLQRIRSFKLAGNKDNEPSTSFHDQPPQPGT